MTGLIRGLLALVLALALLSVACSGGREEAEAQDPTHRPVDAVLAPAQRLRDADLNGFANEALPPALYRDVQAGWRLGTTRWPLDELPLDDQLPALLAALSEEDAEAVLTAAFDRNIAGSDSELRAAIQALGLFAMHYVQADDTLGEHEREGRLQLIAALGQWAAQAPLSDRDRAVASLAQLVPAARQAGMTSDAELGAAGMEQSLERLVPLYRTLIQVLAGYGLDLDAALASREASLEQQTGDRARVRLRYQLAGQPLDQIVEVERHAGRWYRSDRLRRVRAQLAVAAEDADRPGPEGA